MTTPDTFDPIKVDDLYFAQHEEEQNQFYQQLKTLPGSIAGVLFGMETAAVIEKISQEKKLNQKQSEEFSRLIRKILTAEVYLGNIVQELKNKLSVTEETAKELANDLISQLFDESLEDIKKLHVEKFGRPAAEVATPSDSKSQIPEKDKPQIINPGNIVNLKNKN